VTEKGPEGDIVAVVIELRPGEVVLEDSAIYA
jgi:hypothetical protein